jgi:hypothetical protein
MAKSIRVLIGITFFTAILAAQTTTVEQKKAQGESV